MTPTNGKPKTTSDGDGKITAGYIRLTRDESLKTGLSAPAQKSDIEDYAIRSGLPNLVIYEEKEAIGADVPFEKRKAGKRLIADIAAGKIEHLIGRDLDRFCRDELLWPVFRDTCLDHDVTLHTFSGPISLTSPSDRFATGVRVLAAQLELEQTGDRGRRAKRELAKQGRPVGGPPSFGYTSQSRRKAELLVTGLTEEQAKLQAEAEYPHTGQYFVDKREAKIVQLIFNLYVEKRMGCRQIANELNRRGYRRRSGRPWHPDKVRRRINDPTVAGFVPYDEDRYLRARGARTPKHRQHLYAGRHEPIIDPATWHTAQQIKETNTSQVSKRGTAHVASRKYALSGVLECGCGDKMKAGSVQENGHYGSYVCHRRRDYGPDGMGGCGLPRVSIAKADAAFWASLAEIIHSPELVDEVYEAATRILAKREDASSDESDPAENLQKIVADLDRWFERHDAAHTDIEKEAAWQRILQLKHRQKELSEQLEQRPKPCPVELRRITREQVAEDLAGLATLATKAKDRGKSIVQSLVENHGLRVCLVDENTMKISLALRPPGVAEDEFVEHAVRVETVAELPAGEIDAWMKEHEGKCICGVCGTVIPILRRHYWRGLPKFHHKCWASQLTRGRVNPDPAKFDNGTQLAKRLGIGRTTLGRWIKDGKLKPTRVRNGVLLFARKTVDRLVHELT